MGAIYSGLASSDGYLFTTNDIFGVAEYEGAIVKVNKLCGAFIVTARGNYLIKVRVVLDKCLSGLNGVGEGLSLNLAKAIVESFEVEFQREPRLKENSLPFLLLLVGYNLKSSLEHIFVRNRVVKTLKKDEKTEYITGLELHSPVPAKNLFYGHCELSQYLSQQLPSNSLDLETMKLLAYLSMAETQKIDASLFPGIRMATISRDNGFKWVAVEEIQRLSTMSKRVEAEFSRELLGFFNSWKSQWK